MTYMDVQLHGLIFGWSENKSNELLFFILAQLDSLKVLVSLVFLEQVNRCLLPVNQNK